MRETHRLVAVGWKGSSKPFRHYLLLFTCQKECVRTVGECVSERGACWSSERSEEEAEAPLIFSPCRAHRCSQTSGLTLITHIYRQGGGEGAERPDLCATKNHTLLHPLYFLCFLSCFLGTFSPLLLSHLRLEPPPPHFLSLTLHHFFKIKADNQASKRGMKRVHEQLMVC